MLNDDEIRARLASERAFVRLRHGIFDESHREAFKGEGFRVFCFLCALANARQEPKFVAGVSVRQIARFLGISRNTARQVIRRLTPRYIDGQEDGFFVHNLSGNGNHGRGPTGPLFDGWIKNGSPSNGGGSKSDPGGIQNRSTGDPNLIQGGSKSDPPFAVTNDKKKASSPVDVVDVVDVSRRSEAKASSLPGLDVLKKRQQGWSWDPDRKCLVGTEKAKAEMRRLVLDEGFSVEWYKDEMTEINAWLRWNPDRHPKKNWGSFVRNQIHRKMTYARKREAEA